MNHDFGKPVHAMQFNKLYRAMLLLHVEWKKKRRGWREGGMESGGRGRESGSGRDGERKGGMESGMGGGEAGEGTDKYKSVL